ncbi:hypothetical protein ZBT109_2270 [Zymobacter palmae]|uniref:Uncharacterized protein n=1 Tax=Zymobacter palmae TaxID=33074 RepID=A0A348HHA0_9GAMM|nr:hypothetical protein ZBT109_2270 [Zymobacter palmae]
MSMSDESAVDDALEVVAVAAPACVMKGVAVNAIAETPNVVFRKRRREGETVMATPDLQLKGVSR